MIQWLMGRGLLSHNNVSVLLRGASLKNSFIKNVWSFFISLKVTIAILIIISLTSIFGTIIPQNESPAFYLRFYKPSTYKLLHLLQLDNMYHSWWFIALLTFFTVNLICCSLNRFPSFWRMIRKKERDLDEQFLQTLPLKKNQRLKSFDSRTWNTIISTVKKHLTLKTAAVSPSGIYHLFAEQGKFSRFGFYITHFGIVFIIIGGLLGNLGYQGYMQVVEGSSNDTMVLRGTRETKKLDFAIRCDDFQVTFYEDGQKPKEFTSDLTVIDGGKEVKKKRIEVNDPLQYRGVWIYQSSYGTTSGQGSLTLGVSNRTAGDQTRNYKAAVGDRFELEETGYVAEVKRFVPDFSLGQNNQVVSRSEQLKNPAALIALFKDGAPVEEQWIFKNFPDFHGAAGTGPYRFTLLEVSAKEYTGLQLTRDPGVWVVWLGCALLCLGCYIICFLSHQRLWIKVEPRTDDYTLTMAGTSSRNMLSFSQTFTQIQKELKGLDKTDSNA
jgi:cytochrome c biogenesis protein